MKFIAKEQSKLNLEVGDVIEVFEGQESHSRFLLVELWGGNCWGVYGLINLQNSIQLATMYATRKEVMEEFVNKKYRIIKSSNLELREV